ncbi:hypothetical protein [Salipiger sp.]
MRKRRGGVIRSELDAMGVEGGKLLEWRRPVGHSGDRDHALARPRASC